MTGDHDSERIEKARRERARLKELWPREYADGLRLGHTGQTVGEREPGDYPKGFHGWPFECRNAWFAGFNTGHTLAMIEEEEDRNARKTP
jgi:hypothetical protein